MNAPLTRLSRGIFLTGAALLVPLFAQAQQMGARNWGDGQANPAASFLSGAAPEARWEAAPLSAAKRHAPAEERSGLIRVSRVEDLDDQSVTVNWQRLMDGSAVARFTVRSEGAVGLRVRLDLTSRFAAGEMRVAGASGEVELLRMTGLEQELWTPYTDGSVQTIELRLMRAPVFMLPTRVGIGSLMHFDRSPFEVLEDTQAKESSGSCNVDVKCSSTTPGVNTALAERKKSVAHLQFRSGSSGFVCTGTLINSERFPRPYLLTANHCISTAAEAASLTTFWFYENTACGLKDTGTAGRVQVSGGAAMLQTNYNVDSTLLELNNMPPNGVVYSGWDAGDIAVNTPIVSISHPRGDPMKYSEGYLSSQRLRINGYPIDFYGVTFTRGVIEGGSSGSALFTLSNQGLQLRGILLGSTVRNGSMSCSNTSEIALYGRFEAFYNTISPIIQNSAPFNPDTDPGMPGPSVRTLPIGGSVTGSIDYGGDLDVFRINVTQAGFLTVYSTGGNDLVGTLLNSEGTGLVAEDDVETRNNEFGFTYRITTPGTYYVSVGHWVPSSVSGSYQLFSSFSTVSENYSDIWWNADENGWGLAINHQDNVIAGSIYTFDNDREPMYLIINGAVKQTDGSYYGPLLRYRGPAFNAQPWSPAGVSYNQVGWARMNFPTKDTGQLFYSVGSTTVTKNVTRLTYGARPACTFNAFDRSYARNYQDIWWTPSESGWGMSVIHQDDILAVALYVYDANGRDTWYLMGPGYRTANGTGFAYTGALKKLNGPAFNATPFTGVTDTIVGNMTVVFQDGNRGTLTYNVGDQTVTKTIERLTWAIPRTQCE